MMWRTRRRQLSLVTVAACLLSYSLSQPVSAVEPSAQEYERSVLPSELQGAANQEKEDPETSRKIEKTFDKIDEDQDGQISRPEFWRYASGNVQGLPGLPSIRAHRFWDAMTSSIAMTIVTELGDKTFCIAAIMAMQRSRYAVFIGAAAALVVMTALSVGIGYALPALLPRVYTHIAGIVLFAYFGIKLLWDARNMSGSQNGELEEAEEELATSFTTGNTPKEADIESGPSSSHKRKMKKSGDNADGDNTPAAEDTIPGNGTTTETGDDEKRKTKAPSGSILQFLKYNWTTMTSLFTMTFLAEWGDRSQIATIAMSSSKDPLGVALGGFVGHIGCTILAVIGGRLLASKISERTLNICGGALFLIFALIATISGPDSE